MAFNLRNLLAGAVAQVNPFDGGLTYSDYQPEETPDDRFKRLGIPVHSDFSSKVERGYRRNPAPIPIAQPNRPVMPSGQRLVRFVGGNPLLQGSANGTTWDDGSYTFTAPAVQETNGWNLQNLTPSTQFQNTGQIPQTPGQSLREILEKAMLFKRHGGIT